MNVEFSQMHTVLMLIFICIKDMLFLCYPASLIQRNATSQLTKSRSENVLITSFLGYKTLDSNVMGTSIMESFLYGLQNVIV